MTMYAIHSRDGTTWMTREQMREWLDNWFETDQRPHAFTISRVEVVDERPAQAR